MNEVEKRFINSDLPIVADDEWITDGIILIYKKLIKNRFLKSYKHSDEKLTLNNFKKAITENKGECINYISEKGAKCFLMQGGRIAVDIDGVNYIDYAILKTVASSYCIANYFAYDCEYLKHEKSKVVELVDKNDDIIGYIAGCIYDRKVYDGK